MTISGITSLPQMQSMNRAGGAQGPPPPPPGPPPEASDVASKILDDFDADGDGTLSESELETAQSDDRLTELLKGADSDGDGKVSTDELVSALEDFRAKMEEEMAQRSPYNSEGTLSANAISSGQLLNVKS